MYWKEFAIFILTRYACCNIYIQTVQSALKKWQLFVNSMAFACETSESAMTRTNSQMHFFQQVTVCSQTSIRCLPIECIFEFCSWNNLIDKTNSWREYLKSVSKYIKISNLIKTRSFVGLACRGAFRFAALERCRSAIAAKSLRCYMKADQEWALRQKRARGSPCCSLRTWTGDVLSQTVLAPTVTRFVASFFWQFKLPKWSG